MNYFSYPLTIVKSIFLKNPKISFPNQNPRPQTIEPALPRIFNYGVPPGLSSDPTLEWPEEVPLFKPACFHKFQIA